MQTEKFHKNLTIIISLAALLLFFWGIWAVPILSHNEARRMVVIQEMLRSQEWLIPTLNGQTYLAKPPLLYWIGASLATLLGSMSEWVFRLPSGLMALAVVALTHNRVRRYAGQGPALWASAILISSEAFINHGRSAEIGMLLTLWCSLAMFLFLDYLKSGSRTCLALAYASLGLAFLSKGPVALVFFIPPMLVFGMLKDRKTFRGLISLPGWLLLAVIGLSWFGLVMAELGPDAFGQVVSKDISGKMAGATKSSPLYSYPLFLLGAFAPWFLALCFRSRDQFNKLVSSSEGSFFLIWALTPVLIMSLVGEKHGKYILPMFPALAAFLGLWCDGLFQALKKRYPSKAATTALVLVSLLLSGHFLYYLVVEPKLSNHRYTALAPMAAKIQEVGPDLPIYALNDKYIQLTYYLERPMPEKKLIEVDAMLARGEKFLLVAIHKSWQALDDRGLQVVEEYEPFLKRDWQARIYTSKNLHPENRQPSTVNR